MNTLIKSFIILCCSFIIQFPVISIAEDDENSTGWFDQIFSRDNQRASEEQKTPDSQGPAPQIQQTDQAAPSAALISKHKMFDVQSCPVVIHPMANGYAAVRTCVLGEHLPRNVDIFAISLIKRGTHPELPGALPLANPANHTIVALRALNYAQDVQPYQAYDDATAPVVFQVFPFVEKKIKLVPDNKYYKDLKDMGLNIDDGHDLALEIRDHIWQKIPSPANPNPYTGPSLQDFIEGKVTDPLQDVSRYTYWRYFGKSLVGFVKITYSESSGK